MSDYESELRACDPVKLMEIEAIDFDALKRRVHTAPPESERRVSPRQVVILSMAAVVVVLLCGVLALTGDHGTFDNNAPSAVGNASGRSWNFGAGGQIATAAGFTVNDKGQIVEPPQTIFSVGAGLQPAWTSASVYKLNPFSDSQGEAQRFEHAFDVVGTMAPQPTTGFKAEFEAGDANTSSGAVQYFVEGAQAGVPDAGFGVFQYIADGEANWTFDGPVTSSVSAATAQSDLATVNRIWTSLGTGFTLGAPQWEVMELSPQSNATTATETQVQFMLSIDGFPTLQSVQFSFDDTGTLVYADGTDLSVTGAVTFPLETMAEAVTVLNTQITTDCSSFVATLSSGASSTTSTTPVATTTVAPIHVNVASVSLLYEPEMTSNGAPWLIPFYEFKGADGTMAAPPIAALSSQFLAVQHGPGNSCSMTLTQP